MQRVSRQEEQQVHCVGGRGALYQTTLEVLLCPLTRTFSATTPTAATTCPASPLLPPKDIFIESTVHENRHVEAKEKSKSH